jgi:hypothetical protein
MISGEKNLDKDKGDCYCLRVFNLRGNLNKISNLGEFLYAYDTAISQKTTQENGFEIRQPGAQELPSKTRGVRAGVYPYTKETEFRTPESCQSSINERN